MKLYYGLYHDKEKCEIKIITNPNCLIRNEDFITDEIKFFNSCYYVSTNRKEIRLFALKLKEKWTQEAYEKYKKIELMDIKKVYKKRE